MMLVLPTDWSPRKTCTAAALCHCKRGECAAGTAQSARSRNTGSHQLVLCQRRDCAALCHGSCHFAGGPLECLVMPFESARTRGQAPADCLLTGYSNASVASAIAAQQNKQLEVMWRLSLRMLAKRLSEAQVRACRSMQIVPVSVPVYKLDVSSYELQTLLAH